MRTPPSAIDQAVEDIYKVLKRRNAEDIRQKIRSRVEAAWQNPKDLPELNHKILRDQAKTAHEALSRIIAELPKVWLRSTFEQTCTLLKGLQQLPVTSGPSQNSVHYWAAIFACDIIITCSSDPLISTEGGNIHVIAEIIAPTNTETGLLGMCQKVRKSLLRSNPNLRTRTKSWRKETARQRDRHI
jgi:hypothetical protein